MKNWSTSPAVGAIRPIEKLGLPSAPAFTFTESEIDRTQVMVNRTGYWIFPNDAKQPTIEEKSKEMSDMNVPHWQNWMDCIKTRQKPISEIETCVRTTATCVLANLALRHNTALDWDAQAFTVKQHDVKPFLKAKYRSPWKLEV